MKFNYSKWNLSISRILVTGSQTLKMSSIWIILLSRSWSNGRSIWNHKVHYNPKTVPKPPEELQRLVFPFIERCNNSLNALDAYNLRPTACDFLDLMERGRTVLIQNFAQLINIGQPHILFYPEVSKTELFLKYRETMGTFCSTRMNPVSQSLNCLLP